MTIMRCINFVGSHYFVFLMVAFVDTGPAINQINHKSQVLVMLPKKPLICEFFDPQCVEKHNDIKKCHHNNTCDNNEQVCYTAWMPMNDTKDKNKTSTGIQENMLHPSGYNVKKMGCKDREAVDCETNCVQTTKLPDHGHLYCCCVGR